MGLGSAQVVTGGGGEGGGWGGVGENGSSFNP